MSVAVVTGGTHGIGGAIVERAASAGWSVVFCGRCAPPPTNSGAVVGVRADVSVEQDVEALFDEAKTTFGRVDAVINCAGISGNSLLVNLAQLEWTQIRDTNLLGGFLVARAALRAGAAALVLVGSMYQHGAHANAAYATSKGALWGLVQHLSARFPQLRTNLLVPGYVETRLTRSLTDEARDELVRSNPLQRPVTADETAAAAMLLMDPPFSGQMLHATGGVLEAAS